MLATTTRPCKIPCPPGSRCAKIRDDFPSTAIPHKRLRGVTRVTALILAANVHDQRVRALHLDFEGGNQRIFGVDGDVARLLLVLKTNRK
jgi:hypothetical protein